MLITLLYPGAIYDKKMLKRREECNTYLTQVCRHHCNRENPVKRKKHNQLQADFFFVHFSTPHSHPNICLSVRIFQLCHGDGLPEQVCCRCMEQVNVSYSFKLQCETTHITLKHLLEEAQTQVNMINSSRQLEHVKYIYISSSSYICEWVCSHCLNVTQ